MIWELIGYGTVSLIVALVIAAYDGGRRWGVGSCMFLGVAWPLSLPIMLYTTLRLKFKERS